MGERRYHVRGDIDMAASADLQAKLLVLVNATDDDLVVDCRELDFIDSTGIAVLIHTQRLLEIGGRDLRLEHVDGMAKRALELLGLDEVLGLTEVPFESRISDQLG